jgi:hypothetical protein
MGTSIISVRLLTIRRLSQLAFACALVGRAALASADPIPLGLSGSAVLTGIAADSGDCASPVGSFDFTSFRCSFVTSNGFSNTSESQISTGSSAYAQASLGEGFVSAGASGTYFVPNVAYGYATAFATIWDTLIFSGAAPGETATVTMTGNSGFQGDARITARASLGPIDLSSYPLTLAVQNQVYGYLGESASVLTTPTWSLSATTPLYNNVPYLLDLVVSAGAGIGTLGAGDAFITDPFSLNLPPGVTFTSASGDGAPSPSPVPEPSTMTLMLSPAFLLIGRLRSRRRPFGQTNDAI